MSYVESQKRNRDDYNEFLAKGSFVILDSYRDPDDDFEFIEVLRDDGRRYLINTTLKEIETV